MGLSKTPSKLVLLTGWHKGRVKSEHVREAGLDPEDNDFLVMRLAFELTGFPRHLSQHVVVS